MNKDNIALVTGGARGIGKAITESFLEKGYMVIAIFNSSDEKARLMEGKHENLMTFQANVGVESDLKKLFQYLDQNIRHLDVLVNNAGMDIYGYMKDYTSEDWDMMMQVNLKSVFLLSKYCLPYLQVAEDGVIVNISSRLGIPERAVPKFIMYGVTKAGVNLLTTGMAREFEDLGVRVNAVLPTATDTDMLKHVMSEELRNKYRKEGKMGQPGEVAELVMKLVNDRSITGKLLFDPRIA